MLSDEGKQAYIFKVDERCFCTKGMAVVVADTKEEARSALYGLKYADIRDTHEASDSFDNNNIVDQKHAKVLFHRPEKTNRFMTTVWYLEYELFLRVPLEKGIKSFTYSDG